MKITVYKDNRIDGAMRLDDSDVAGRIDTTPELRKLFDARPAEQAVMGAIVSKEHGFGSAVASEDIEDGTFRDFVACVLNRLHEMRTLK